MSRWTDSDAAIALPAGARMVELRFEATGCVAARVLDAA